VHLNRAVIARSNVTFTFVCNKTNMPGGVLAEGRRQKAARIAGIARHRVIADIGKVKALTTKDTKEHKGFLSLSLSLSESFVITSYSFI
jgi:hypothetical protein